MTIAWNIVLSVLCFAAGVYSCDFNPTGHQNLDFERYQGKWFLLETGPLRSNESGPLDCVYESYNSTTSPLIFGLNWHGQRPNGEVVIDGGLVTLPHPRMQSTAHFFIDGTIFESKILATDYVTWAIEYTCHDGFPYERFMLRSRTPNLSQEVRTTLHNVINSYGVNVADFAVVKHDACV